jgi:hypothetical protein
MKGALRLLQLLTQAMPPDSPAKHNLTLSDDGKDLVLTLALNGRWQEVNFSEADDYDKPPEQAAGEIHQVLVSAGLIEGEIA